MFLLLFWAKVMKNAQLKQAAYGHVQVARVVGGESTHVFRKQQATPLANVGIYYTADVPFSPQSDLELDFFLAYSSFFILFD